MSSLWTPSGEHVPRDEPAETSSAPTPPGEPSSGTPSAEELTALRELHAQLLATPVEDVIANHAAGLLQLALVLLGLGTPPDEQGRMAQPDLAKAGVAVDALAALVEGLGPRLGAHEAPLREALAQVQTAYVQVGDALESTDGSEPDPRTSDDD